MNTSLADRCRSCGAPIRWGRHAVTGGMMPLDWAESRGGPWRIDQLGQVRHRPAPDAGYGYTSHFATCPNAAQHRKSRPRRKDA